MTKTGLLFFVIAAEGYVVLAAELLAIRQLIPFVGSGTEIVAIVISAVLLPLAAGYHAGGRSFRRRWARCQAAGKPSPTVRGILLKNMLSALIVLAPGLSYPFLELFFGGMQALGIINRLAQTSLYSLLFLVGPVFALGQTLPLVSNYFSRARLSEITGRMLFFSTAGSFFGSVFSTIVLMMWLGVHVTVIVTLALLALLVLLLSRRFASYEALLAALALGVTVILNNPHTMRALSIVSDNAYNTVTVHDLPREEARVLFTNRSSSSKLAENPEQRFAYIRYIDEIFLAPLRASNPPRDILMIGAGGFTLGLEDAHNRYTYVDIDPALKDVAETYFLKKPLLPNKRFVATSARAFLHGQSQAYDLIVVDVYTNMIAVPMETTTREFLREVKRALKPDGIVVANVIMTPDFRDRFSVRYDHTFGSVFPVFTRQVVKPFNPWEPEPKPANVLYIYYNRPGMNDTAIYTDDKNTYSLDR